MNRSLVRPLSALATLLGCLLIAACGQRAAAPAPQPAPPTATARPRPTRTPPAPTATQAPPTAVPSPTPFDPAAVGRALQTAYDTTVALERYQLSVTITISDQAGNQQAQAAPGVYQVAYSAKGPPRQGFGTITISYDALVIGSDARGGIATSFDSAGDAYEPQTIEVIRIGDAVYMHCPCVAQSLGDPDETWYTVEADSQLIDALPAHGASVLPYAIDGLDFAAMRPLGQRSLGDQQCSAYAGTAEDARFVTDGLLGGILPGGTAGLNGLFADDAPSEGELTFSVCPDGYLRQVDVAIGGTVMGQTFAIRSSLALAPAPAEATIAAPAAPKPYREATAGVGTATVFNGGNIRSEPSLNGEVYGQLHAGETVDLVAKSADGSWYYVEAPEASGWVSATLLTVDPQLAAAVPVFEPQLADGLVAGPLATVANGGNLRAAPRLDGAVLDQVHAFERVNLLARTSDGNWWKITNPRQVTGWVHRSLLTIDAATWESVPVE